MIASVSTLARSTGARRGRPGCEGFRDRHFRSAAARAGFDQRRTSTNAGVRRRPPLMARATVRTSAGPWRPSKFRFDVEAQRSRRSGDRRSSRKTHRTAGLAPVGAACPKTGLSPRARSAWAFTRPRAGERPAPACTIGADAATATSAPRLAFIFDTPIARADEHPSRSRMSRSGCLASSPCTKRAQLMRHD